MDLLVNDRLHQLAIQVAINNDYDPNLPCIPSEGYELFTKGEISRLAYVFSGFGKSGQAKLCLSFNPANASDTLVLYTRYDTEDIIEDVSDIYSVWEYWNNYG